MYLSINRMSKSKACRRPGRQALGVEAFADPSGAPQVADVSISEGYSAGLATLALVLSKTIPGLENSTWLW